MLNGENIIDKDDDINVDTKLDDLFYGVRLDNCIIECNKEATIV